MYVFLSFILLLSCLSKNQIKSKLELDWTDNMTCGADRWRGVRSELTGHQLTD